MLGNTDLVYSCAFQVNMIFPFFKERLFPLLQWFCALYKNRGCPKSQMFDKMVGLLLLSFE